MYTFRCKPGMDLNDHNETPIRAINDTPAYVKLNPNVDALSKLHSPSILSNLGVLVVVAMDVIDSPWILSIWINNTTIKYVIFWTLDTNDFKLDTQFWQFFLFLLISL